MTTVAIVLLLAIIGVLVFKLYQKNKTIQSQLAVVNDQSTQLIEQETTIVEARRETLAKANEILEIRRESKEELEERMKLWEKTEAPKIRADALSKQKQVRSGFTSEHFAPFAIPLWAAEDYFRVGGSVDYLVLAGADAVRDKRQDQVDEVVFLDIKTGKADLNTVQRRIRDAIIEGRVAFATYNMDTKEMKRWELGQARSTKQVL